MGIIKIERFFVNQYISSGFFSFYTPMEISKELILDVNNIRKQLQEMSSNGILIKHPFKVAYNLSKEYYNKAYIQINKENTLSNVV